MDVKYPKGHPFTFFGTETVQNSHFSFDIRFSQKKTNNFFNTTFCVFRNFHEKSPEHILKTALFERYLERQLFNNDSFSIFIIFS